MIFFFGVPFRMIPMTGSDPPRSDNPPIVMIDLLRFLCHRALERICFDSTPLPVLRPQARGTAPTPRHILSDCRFVSPRRTSSQTGPDNDSQTIETHSPDARHDISS